VQVPFVSVVRRDYKVRESVLAIRDLGLKRHFIAEHVFELKGPSYEFNPNPHCFKVIAKLEASG
jgi:hypothetical protein